MPLTTRDLRRRWKPHKERLSALAEAHPTAVRFHRACSWLQKAETMLADPATARDPASQDLVLLCQWTAFNALYGQWDENHSEPLGDRPSWRAFLDRVLKLDADGRVSGVLQQKQKLVLAILDDAYLAGFFWRDPSTGRALQGTKIRREAPLMFKQQRWPLLLERSVEPVYFLRCQLVHGGATLGGRLNRDSLRRCTGWMAELLPAVLEVWIERGAEQDWGPMCYPPVGASVGSRR